MGVAGVVGQGGVVAVAAGVGLLAAALAPRLAYRLAVPAGTAPRSGCASCGLALPAGVSGWVGPASRCPGCGGRLGRPGVLAGAVAAAGCAGLAVVVAPAYLWPYLAVTAFGVLLASIDLTCARLPRALVTPAIWVGAAALVTVAAPAGDWAGLARALGGAAVLGGVFLLLYLLPGQGLGFGDVRLAVLLGGFLGFLGWRDVLLGAVLPWLINGPVALVLLATGRVKRRDALPFGPAMLAGALVAVLFGEWFYALGR